MRAMSRIASALFALPIMFGLCEPSQARPGIAIDNVEFLDYVDLGPGYQYLHGAMTVPDASTTRRVSGNLRLYDLHIAKLFELTHYQCQNWGRSPIPYQGERGIVWNYYANRGDAWMGIFTIDCADARTVMEIFAQGGTESTRIYYFETSRTYNVPTLAITTSANETARWMDFVQRVPPQESP